MVVRTSDVNKSNQDVTALFLALYRGHCRLAQMLLEHGARPDCSPSISGIHAAASRGYKEEMELLDKRFWFDPDVKGKVGATLVVYALQQLEKEAWETVLFLFYLGATKGLVVGKDLQTCAEL